MQGLYFDECFYTITSTAQKNPFTCRVVEDFYDFKTIARDKLNTKKLRISTAVQLRLTKEKFGTVMLANGHSELSGWCETNILKSGVKLEDFKNIRLQKSRTHFEIPEKKIADIKKMLPYLHDDAKKYFQEKLGHTSQVSAVKNND